MANLSASNITSGFIDLATYDEQEKYLYGGMDSIAYFVREIRKATWFTQIPVVLTRSSGNPAFNTQWSVSISRAGDYLLHTWLRLSLSSVASAFTNAATPPYSMANGDTLSVLRWTKNFMHNLISDCSITFNDLTAARFDNYHLDFWSAFTTPAGKRQGYLNMIGTVDSLTNPVAKNGLPLNSNSTLPAATLNLPLPFFYTRDCGLALPTAALPYNEMRINFAFNDWTALLIKDTYTASSASAGTWTSIPAVSGDVATAPSMSNVQVWANYAIVSNTERQKMACGVRDMVIEQVQEPPVMTFNPSTSATNQYDIRLSHAIKELFFSARNTANTSSWSNYTTSAQKPLGPGDTVATATTSSLFGVVDFAAGSDPILNTTVMYENTNRLYQMGSDYYSLVNPWYSAPVIPLETGYHVYSYSLDFYAIDPMGSTNYGKLTNVSVVPAASSAAQSSNNTYNFVLSAVNNNIIRFSGGKTVPSTVGCFQRCNDSLKGKQCKSLPFLLKSI